MPVKKTIKQQKPEPKDDDLMPQVLRQLDILNKSIQMINDDIGKLYDKLERVSSRMGL